MGTHTWNTRIFTWNFSSKQEIFKLMFLRQKHIFVFLKKKKKEPNERSFSVFKMEVVASWHSSFLHQIHNRYEGKDVSNHKRNLVIAGGVTLSVIVSPVVAAVTVGQCDTLPTSLCFIPGIPPLLVLVNTYFILTCHTCSFSLMTVLDSSEKMLTWPSLRPSRQGLL